MHRRVAAVEGLMCTSTDLQSPRKPSALNLSELSNLRSFTPVSGIHTPLEQDGQIGDSYFAGSADSAGDGKSFMSTESPRPPLNTMGTMASFNSTLAPQKSFLPPEISSMELSKQELLRQRVIYELIQTEGDYVRDLQVWMQIEIEISRYYRRNRGQLTRPKVMVNVGSSPQGINFAKLHKRDFQTSCLKNY